MISKEVKLKIKSPRVIVCFISFLKNGKSPIVYLWTRYNKPNVIRKAPSTDIVFNIVLMFYTPPNNDIIVYFIFCKKC
jgi:hypothetical protein